MRAVEHLAVDADDARISGRLEGRYDSRRLSHRLGRGRERSVDDRHLIGVDRHLAGETVTLGLGTFRGEGRHVAKAGEYGVDRGDFRGSGRENGRQTGVTEEIGVAAVLVAGRACAYR